MGGYHSELNGLFYCIAFVRIDPRVLTVARWNRHSQIFANTVFSDRFRACYGQKKACVFDASWSRYILLQNFVRHTSLRRLHSEYQLESWKTPKSHKFSLKVPSALYVPRAAHQVTRHTLARAFLYAIGVCRLSIGPLVTEISAWESTRAERFFAFFTNFAPRF